MESAKKRELLSAILLKNERQHPQLQYLAIDDAVVGSF